MTKETRIRVLCDEDPDNPRGDHWKNFGVIAHTHPHYILGEERVKGDPAEWFKENVPEGSVVLPLYLYDHSGITISTGAFSCPWDSGQVGWIYADPERIKSYLDVSEITEAVREDVVKILESEVKVFDGFLTGNVWGYVVEEREVNPCECCKRPFDWEQVDSCWGFYGDDALEDMQSLLETEGIEDKLEEAWENRF